MLSDRIRDAARQTIAPRFELLDTTLNERLDELCAMALRLTRADELAHVGVNVRLACEHDMNERAFAAWRALRKAHQSLAGIASATLLRDIKIELRLYMRDASINLANRLAEHAATLAPTFAGNQPLDVEWIKRMQRLAEEKQMSDVEQYIKQLPRSLKSWVGGDR